MASSEPCPAVEMQAPERSFASASGSAAKPGVVFVMGGPGSGKGTQCQKILCHFDFVHLSVGELLRAEVKAGSEIAAQIQEAMDQGVLVAPQISVPVLLKAINNSRVKRILLDGFPRVQEDRYAFEQLTGITPDFVLYFDCPEEELMKRLLARKRLDDNEGTIKERLEGFRKDTLPLVNYYEGRGLLRRVNGASEAEHVFNATKYLFTPYLHDELLEVSEELLRGIDVGDYATYERLCDPELTAFEPESQGQLVEKLPFHNFYFMIRSSNEVEQRVSTICAPKVTMLSEDVALVTYTRLMQERGIPKAGFSDAYNETRVWKRKKLAAGKWQWKHLHFHRSKAPTESLC